MYWINFVKLLNKAILRKIRLNIGLQLHLTQSNVSLINISDIKLREKLPITSCFTATNVYSNCPTHTFPTIINSANTINQSILKAKLLKPVQVSNNQRNSKSFTMHWTILLKLLNTEVQKLNCFILVQN